VPRLGTEEKAKITAAQATTGSQAERGDRRAPAVCTDIVEC
jgi:hypothetical protein